MPFQGDAREQIKDRFYRCPYNDLLDTYTNSLRSHVQDEYHYGSDITADNLKRLMRKAIASKEGLATLSPAPFDSVVSSVTKVKNNQSNVGPGMISTRVEHPDVLSVTYNKDTNSFSAGRANSSIIISESRPKPDRNQGIHGFKSMYTSKPRRSQSAQAFGIESIEATQRSTSPLFEGLADMITNYAIEKQFI